MANLNDRILKSLKQARKDKGLSQRELSTKSGVPQSHISKIESGSVDLRLSSLVALARTLNLELELVPRKTVPAVQSIVRRSINADFATGRRHMQKQIENYRETINAVTPSLALPRGEFEKLSRLANEIAAMNPNMKQIHLITSSQKALEKALAQNSGIPEAIDKAMGASKTILNALAHSGLEQITKTLPAYSLDDEADDE